MEKSIKSVVYLVCIDNGIVVCGEKENVCIFPSIVFNEQFKDVNMLKSRLLKQIKINIERYNLCFLSYFREENTYFYSLVINMNKKEDYPILPSEMLKNAKTIKFLGLVSANWDDGSRLVIEALQHNPNFKDAFTFIKCDSKFNYYSDSSKKIINRVFNKISNIWQSDKPDVIVETLNGITGVECFRINASGKYIHGSIGIVGKKEMENELINNNFWEPTTISRHFNNSLSNLWADFKFQYKKHNKTRDYKNNLIKIGKKRGVNHSFGLYVEDTTLLGSFQKENRKNLTPLYIFNIKEFWDLFLRNKSILFIIFQQTEGNNKAMFFITKHDYENLLSKGLIHSLNNIEALFFNNPHLIGTTFPVPYK